jgi:LemA protein
LAVVEAAEAAAEAQAAAGAHQEDGDMALTFIVLALALVFFYWYYLAYNSLISARNAVEQSWSNVDVELKRRFDLIDNLVSVVKGYAQHEGSTFEKIANLRRRTDNVADPVEAKAVHEEMSKSIVQLVAVAEAYPQLKANENFLNLQGQLAETENRIAERRNTYNQCVSLYLNRCQTVPTNIIASVHSFPDKLFFEAPDELVKDAPKVEIP